MTHWAAWSWRFRPDEFRVLSTRRAGGGREPRRLADLVRGARAVLRAGRDAISASRARPARTRSSAPRRKGYPNPPHPPRTSSAALRRRGPQARLPSLPGAGRDQLAPLRRASALLLRRRMSRLRLLRSTPRGRPSRSRSRGRSRPASSISARTRGVFEIPLGTRRARARRALSRRAGARAGGARAAGRARRRTRSARRSSCCSRSPARSRTGSPTRAGSSGANLTFHLHAGAVFLMDGPARGYTGFEAQTAIDDLHPSDPKRGFIRGGVIAELNTINHQPLGWAFNADGYPQLGARLGRAAQALPARLPALGRGGEHPRRPADREQPHRPRPRREGSPGASGAAHHAPPAPERSRDAPLVHAAHPRDRRGRRAPPSAGRSAGAGLRRARREDGR